MQLCASIMDIEQFITMVYEHRCLWDQSDPNYPLRDHQRKAWTEISDEMEISVDELKKKWRGLRDTFGKELKKMHNTKSGQVAETEPSSKWQYFKYLLFLRNTISRREVSVSTVQDTSETSDGGVSANASTSSNYASSSLPSPSMAQYDQEIPKACKYPLAINIKKRHSDEFDTSLLAIEEEKSKCCRESANDPDAQFLISLLPFLKDIPKHRKLMVRSKLQQVLIDEQNAISSSK